MTVHRIGFSSDFLGEVKLQITFNGLNLDIVVKCLVLRPGITSLLVMKDMVSSSNYISILNQCFYHKGLTHPLEMINYFLCHHWHREYMDCNFSYNMSC